MKYDAVLEGGGVKIPGLVGALAGIEANRFTPDSLAGTSAGAIVAAMRAAGYTPNEMANILFDLDFKRFKDGAPCGTKTYNLLRHKGIYHGDAFLEMMREFMANKGVKYFGDLRTGLPDPKYTYFLRVFAADISNGQLVQLPEDMRKYGHDPDRVEIAWAVRASMSIPYFFHPVKLNGTYLVDGGLLSNFPIGTFDSVEAPEWPTFGVMLKEADSDKKHKVRGPITFLEAMFNTVLKAHDKRYIRSGDYIHRTIQVPVGNVSATDFNLPLHMKLKLYNSGLQAASAFLADWDFDNYQKWAKQHRGIR